jgi:hypothetical protein
VGADIRLFWGDVFVDLLIKLISGTGRVEFVGGWRLSGGWAVPKLHAFSFTKCPIKVVSASAFVSAATLLSLGSTCLLLFSRRYRIRQRQFWESPFKPF